jgi:integrase/recombinase XerD
MTRFDCFIRDRQYLSNVSDNTVRWYRCALKWLPGESPTQDQLREMVMKMRERGLKETGCNAAIRAINAYLHWDTGSEKKCGAGCTHPHIKSLKEPQVIMPSFSLEQVQKLLKWKPKRKDYHERRLHLMVMFLLDTGCRISEALGVHVSDVDMDNLLVTLNGKGRKQRIVPISFVLRKAIHRFISDFQCRNGLLFSTLDGVSVRRMTALRSVKQLCKRLGFDPPARTIHAMRHTFAANYIRQGGSTFHLQKSLGHSSLEMSRRYANLTTDDLSKVHQRVGLLR